MADRWAKIHSKVSDSADFAAVADEDPFAAMLFLLLLPQADVYGILPGEPGWLRWNVCRLMNVTEAQIDHALGLLTLERSDAALVVRYEADRGEYLWLPGWNEHQDTRWDRVAPPKYPCPPGWQRPAGLVQHCEQEPSGRLAGVIPDWSRHTPGVSPESAGSSPGVVPFESALDVDSDTDSDTESESERSTDSAASQKNATPPVPQPSDQSKRRAKASVQRAEEKRKADAKPKRKREPTPKQRLTDRVIEVVNEWPFLGGAVEEGSPQDRERWKLAGYMVKRLGTDAPAFAERVREEGLGPSPGANTYGWLQMVVGQHLREDGSIPKRPANAHSDWAEPLTEWEPEEARKTHGPDA